MILEKRTTTGLVLFVLLLIVSGKSNCVMAQSGYNTERMGTSFEYPEVYSNWANGFLAGNGKMGVIVFGNPLEETVIYNDRDFFMAATHERSFNKVSKQNLDKIREYCVQEKWKEANDLANEVHGWKNGGEGDKHPGFKMTIDIPEDGDVQDYMRTCNFHTGEITVTWKDNRGTWVRKTFVSRKDNVVVQHLTAPGNGTISCEIKLDDDPGMNFPSDMKFTSTATTDGLNIRAMYPNPDKTNNAGYEGVTRVETDGGMKTIVGNVLKIEGANSITMLTRSKRYFSDCTGNWNKGLIQADLEKLPVDYNKLLKGQIETHQAVYDRVKIDFNASEAERKLPNEELLQMQRQSQKPVLALWERIFDSGRYLYLSSSSDYAAPDLLGIWTGDCNVGWSGYYHLDANLNLQIAAGNIGDMPEAMEGYFTLMERLSDGFRTNADKLLGCRGLLGGGNTAGLNGLISALNYDYPYQYVTGEMGWLLYPFWEHYLITGDVEFLRERLYPMLREMADFYEDFLVETDKNGKYIFAGSISPETKPAGVGLSLVNNSSFDIAGAKFCLKTLIDASNILQLNQGKDGVEKWQAMLDKMPPYLINEEGAFKEWAWPGLGETHGHRHSSLLLAAWPLYEISPEATPELYKAARFALAKKDEHKFEDAGHGLLQAALHACKLKYGESVGDKLMRLTSEDFFFNSLSSAHYVNNRVFCTDVCNSVPAVMIEMLVGSSADMLELLPALPSYLTKGEISGVKALNRVTVENMKWDIKKGAVECILKSDIDQQITLIERQGIAEISSKADVETSFLGDIARIINLKKGQKTIISLRLKNN